MRLATLSYHGRPYYMPADSISPYCHVPSDISGLPRPFAALCIHPACGVGVPVAEAARQVIDIPPRYPPRRAKRWRNILNKNRDATAVFEHVPAGAADYRFLMDIAGPLFEEKAITPEEVMASSEYTRLHPGVLLTVTVGGECMARDYSSIEAPTVYGIVCHWNHAHARRRPGSYCILKLIEYCEEHGYEKYDLGGLNYDYKAHYATHTEESLGLVLADPTDIEELPAAMLELHGIHIDPSIVNATAKTKNPLEPDYHPREAIR